MTTAKHACVAETLDVVVQDEDTVAVVSEYAPGQNLRDYLAGRGGRIKAAQARYLARQVATGVAEIHRRGMMHLDLKPENIFVSGASGAETVKVAGYGIAELLMRAGQADKIASGERGYHAPESVPGASPAQSADIYALGLIIVKMLTGSSSKGSKGNLTCTRPLRRIVQRCLDPDPSRRHRAWTVAAELFDDEVQLESFSWARGILRSTGRFRAPTLSRRAWFSVAVVTILSVLTPMAIYWVRGGQQACFPVVVAASSEKADLLKALAVQYSEAGRRV